MATNNSDNNGSLYSAGNGKILIARATGQAIAANITAGTGVTVINGTNSITIAASGGSGTSLTKSINQVAHGLSVGNAVYLNSSTYTKAIATSAAAAEVIGIVTTVTDADNFIISLYGYVTGLSGLTAGSIFWLSDTNAGLISATIPTTVGNIQKPLLDADSTTSGYFYNYRGNVIPAGAGVGGVGATTTLNYNGVTQTIRASSNVTSVTYSSVGRYILNFTSSYPNANYFPSIAINPNGTTDQTPYIDVGAAIPATNNLHVCAAGFAFVDNDYYIVTIVPA